MVLDLLMYAAIAVAGWFAIGVIGVTVYWFVERPKEPKKRGY